MMFVDHTNHLAHVAENLPEFARVCKCEVQAPLHTSDAILQVELNSTCPHNAYFKLVLPISRPLNPLARTSCIMMFVYHTNHVARVAENLPEFARVCKCEV